MISFKGAHFPKEVILFAVFFYVRYGVSYRDLEEIMEERGVKVDHATLNRWVIAYSPLIAVEAKKRKQIVAGSWRIDETYLKVKGQWVYHTARWIKVVLTRRAAATLDIDETDVLIAQIHSLAPDVADSLQKLAQSYQFE